MLGFIASDVSWSGLSETLMKTFIGVPQYPRLVKNRIFKIKKVQDMELDAAAKVNHKVLVIVAVTWVEV